MERVLKLQATGTQPRGVNKRFPVVVHTERDGGTLCPCGMPLLNVQHRKDVALLPCLGAAGVHGAALAAHTKLAVKLSSGLSLGREGWAAKRVKKVKDGMKGRREI